MVLRKVSVIIPIFNLVDYVEQLIDNLKKQTYKNAEYLIIDDGSTDKSIDVLLTLTKNDTRFKIIQTRKTGVSDSRNLGLKIAAGEFVIFIDGDDFF
ncbi:glycosyltransferase family 2 protein [Weissella cibaria]